ncbi:MAG: hypothetical protein M1839_001258 [Geoglossum umbratile]|nr:MAG: hypothetical protein M1839_001258 [Geoglossum umbratile]
MSLQQYKQLANLTTGEIQKYKKAAKSVEEFYDALPPDDKCRATADTLPWKLLPHVENLEGSIATPSIETQTRVMLYTMFKMWCDSASKIRTWDLPDQVVRMSRICLAIRNLSDIDDRRRSEILQRFTKAKVVDKDLPLQINRVRQVLSGEPIRLCTDFNYQQYKVVIRALKRGQHVTYNKDFEHLPLLPLGMLGTGGFGTVEKVKDVFDDKVYARKYVKNVRGQGIRGLKNEIDNLRKLDQHPHIVELVSTYTIGTELGLLLLPVAKCNLREFLATQSLRFNKGRFLNQTYGCLSVALAFLHSNSIRHKDIKPENILVCLDGNFNVLLTDFGLARNFENGASASTGKPDSWTYRYIAPEVYGYKRRGRKSDVFSLGCVFLEIATIQANEDFNALEQHFGSDDRSFQGNLARIPSWISLLRGKCGESTVNQLPLKWCERMLWETEDKRPFMEDLVREMFEEEGAKDRYFCHTCQREPPRATPLPSLRATSDTYLQPPQRHPAGGTRRLSSAGAPDADMLQPSQPGTPEIRVTHSPQ